MAHEADPRGIRSGVGRELRRFVGDGGMMANPTFSVLCGVVVAADSHARLRRCPAGICRAGLAESKVSNYGPEAPLSPGLLVCASRLSPSWRRRSTSSAQYADWAGPEHTLNPILTVVGAAGAFRRHRVPREGASRLLPTFLSRSRDKRRAPSLVRTAGNRWLRGVCRAQGRRACHSTRRCGERKVADREDLRNTIIATALAGQNIVGHFTPGGDADKAFMSGDLMLSVVRRSRAQHPKRCEARPPRGTSASVAPKIAASVSTFPRRPQAALADGRVHVLAGPASLTDAWPPRSQDESAGCRKAADWQGEPSTLPSA